MEKSGNTNKFQEYLDKKLQLESELALLDEEYNVSVSIEISEISEEDYIELNNQILVESEQEPFESQHLEEQSFGNEEYEVEPVFFMQEKVFNFNGITLVESDVMDLYHFSKNKETLDSVTEKVRESIGKDELFILPELEYDFLHFLGTLNQDFKGSKRAPKLFRNNSRLDERVAFFDKLKMGKRDYLNLYYKKFLRINLKEIDETLEMIESINNII